MAKLNKKAIGFSIISVLLLSAYFIVDSLVSNHAQLNTSIFGRTVYEQNSSIGKMADPNYQITFPTDNAAHHKFDIEWWYLTANLEDASGNPYGLQWTLFRFRNPNSNGAQTEGWHNDQIYMAHASIHSLDTHLFSEKFARGGVGNAGLTKLPFSLFIDNWEWINSNADSGLFPSTLSFTTYDTSKSKAEAKASFMMKQTGPFVKHGQNGYSVKSASQHASHYYSAPFIDIEGELIKENDSGVTETINLKGNAWFDHEWTSQLLDNNTQGWDWLSLHLENGSKIMAFRMRLKDQKDFITGSYITNTGEQFTLQDSDLSLLPISTTKVDDKQLPLDWKLTIPSKNISLTVSTIKDRQWNNALIPYYEGMVTIEGSHAGNGFLELTGY